jgi:hypothetical protein
LAMSKHIKERVSHEKSTSKRPKTGVWGARLWSACRPAALARALWQLRRPRWARRRQRLCLCRAKGLHDPAAAHSHPYRVLPCLRPVDAAAMSSTPRAKPKASGLAEGASPRATAPAKAAGDKKPKAKKPKGSAPTAPMSLGMPMNKCARARSLLLACARTRTCRRLGVQRHHCPGRWPPTAT